MQRFVLLGFLGVYNYRVPAFWEKNYIGLRQSTSASIFFCKTSICKHTTVELYMCLCIDVSFLGELFQPKFAQLAILQLCSYRQDWGGEQGRLLFLRHNSYNRLKNSSQRKSTREGQGVASILEGPFSLSLVTVALRASPFLWNLKNTFTLALGRPCSAVRTFKLYAEVVCIGKSILVCTSLPCLKRCLMFRLL